MTILPFHIGAILWATVWWRHRGHEDFAHHGQSHRHQCQPSPQIPHSPVPELVSFENLSLNTHKRHQEPKVGLRSLFFLSQLSFVWPTMISSLNSRKVSSLKDFVFLPLYVSCWSASMCEQECQLSLSSSVKNSKSMSRVVWLSEYKCLCDRAVVRRLWSAIYQVCDVAVHSRADKVELHSTACVTRCLRVCVYVCVQERETDRQVYIQAVCLIRHDGSLVGKKPSGRYLSMTRLSNVVFF